MAAIRQEELTGHAHEALVYEFPTGPVRRRSARQQQVVFVRRRVAAALVAVILAVGSGLAVLNAGGGPVTSRPGAPGAVRMEAGSTLWDLARRYGPPGGDPRAYVQATRELNGLEGPPVAGARIKLPRSS